MNFGSSWHRVLLFLKKKQVDTSALVMAPMPGRAKVCLCGCWRFGGGAPGGGCVLEAMKMQNSLVETLEWVKKVNFKTGDTVNEGDVIVELE
ncbi:hypothetical protein RRG08_005789 [Elysia crispata]|uniref:Lipoyl-binding domain-containing protein n=1 Tax=Elysia crispata TaxID=231223 RepID=A0AAE0ZVP9_9GAST|nr:hypothetical protein RRG08_005789 [Elysia crispata]